MTLRSTEVGLLPSIMGRWLAVLSAVSLSIAPVLGQGGSPVVVVGSEKRVVIRQLLAMNLPIKMDVKTNHLSLPSSEKLDNPRLREILAELLAVAKKNQSTAQRLSRLPFLKLAVADEITKASSLDVIGNYDAKKANSTIRRGSSRYLYAQAASGASLFLRYKPGVRATYANYGTKDIAQAVLRLKDREYTFIPPILLIQGKVTQDLQYGISDLSLPMRLTRDYLQSIAKEDWFKEHKAGSRTVYTLMRGSHLMCFEVDTKMGGRLVSLLVRWRNGDINHNSYHYADMGQGHESFAAIVKVRMEKTGGVSVRTYTVEGSIYAVKSEDLRIQIEKPCQFSDELNSYPKRRYKWPPSNWGAGVAPWILWER